MNVQIYSNTKNQEGDVNYNNKFAVALPESIDGENKTRYIRPLNVTYPLMINNVQEETCSIRFKYNLFWNSYAYITVETDWIYLTPGRYTLKKLIKKLKANLYRIWSAFFNTVRRACWHIYRFRTEIHFSS
jgi:hypothetical protein